VFLPSWGDREPDLPHVSCLVDLLSRKWLILLPVVRYSSI